MFVSHSIYLIGFASQSVFAATLALLAINDRRTRGTGWLAAGSGLQLLMTISRALLQNRSDAPAKAIAGGLLILGLFFLYMGLRWFAVRRPLRNRRLPVFVALAIVATVGITLWNVDYGASVARLGAAAIIIMAIPFVWNPRFASMRNPGRVTSVVLTLIAATLMARIWIDSLVRTPGVDAADFAARVVTLILATMLSFCFVSFYVAEAQRRLHDETRLDSLTGLPNRLSLMETASRAVAQAGQAGTALGLLVLDVDFFKRLNDTWGHAVGDHALEVLGNVLREELEPLAGGQASAARLGGEEFAVLLPGLSMAAAAGVAETIRGRIEDLRLYEAGQVVTMTVSIGVCDLRDGEVSWLDMMRRADKALYMAKHEGRNRVRVWSEHDGVRALQAADSKIRLWRSNATTAAQRGELRSISEIKRAEVIQ